MQNILNKRKLRWLYGIVALVAVLLLLDWLKPHVIPKRFGVVEEGVLYRSGQMPAHLVASLAREHGFKTIIALNGSSRKVEAERVAVEPLGVEHVKLQLRGDGTGNADVYVETLARMRDASQNRNPLLVHCAAGSQRTGAAVAMYRILFQGWQPSQVLDELQQYDWKPEKSWVLIDYINENLPYVQQQLLKRGVLAQAVELVRIERQHLD